MGNLLNNWLQDSIKVFIDLMTHIMDEENAS